MQAFTALSDNTRRGIVELLASTGEMSATDISRHFSISAPAVSQHLKVLREANLLTMEKRAQHRIYSLDMNGLQDMDDWMRHMRSLWNARFDNLNTHLQEQKKENRHERR